MSTEESYDILVLGGGPAGCAAATLLARRAHTVGLVRPSEPPASGLAESIPPSARRVLEELGALESVEAAGFHPNRGNSVWWADRPVRREDFAPDAEGFHTDRGALESVLVRVAEAAGVDVHDGLAARSARRLEPRWEVACEGSAGEVRLGATWLIDATGRKGVLARDEREPDRSTTTLALVRRWRRSGGWSDDLAHRTLVESYPTGWAWSVPLSEEVRCVTAMIDQRERSLEGVSVSERLDTELDATRRVGALREAAEPLGEGWACPASLYTSRRFARDGRLVAGDAGSFIDPLSSFGVKKALSSGWLAGVVAHTALVDPEMAPTALDFFDRREREVYRRYRAISASFFRAAAEAHETEYWLRRARAAEEVAAPASSPSEPTAIGHPDPDRLDAPIPESAVRRAFAEIKDRLAFDAVPGPDVTVLERPAVEGQRVVLLDHLATPSRPEGIRYVRGVDLTLLLEIAPRHPQVPDGWAAYNAVAPPVTLPDYLTGLATAVAADLLVLPPRVEGG